MRHIVSIGDEIIIKGHLFIVTEFRAEMDKPSVLITKQPVELMVKEGHQPQCVASEYSDCQLEYCPVHGPKLLGKLLHPAMKDMEATDGTETASGGSPPGAP